MNVELISKKALDKLRAKRIAPTPEAYFAAYYEIVKDSGLDSAFSYHVQWLDLFEGELKKKLSVAKTPDEFVHLLAKILKDEKSDYSHLSQLKALVRILFDIMNDIFSINAKSRYHALFRKGLLNNEANTQLLCKSWENFRDSKVHIEVLKKIVGIISMALKTPNPHTHKVSKAALEMYSTLLMHPESISDFHTLDLIERVLGYAPLESVVQAKRVTQAFLYQSLQYEAQNLPYCVVVFKVCDIDFGKNEYSEQVALDKAVQILKKMCLNRLENSEFIGHSGKCFVLLVSGESSPIELNATNITKELKTQKFSYKQMTLYFDIEVEILNRAHFSSAMELNEKLNEILKRHSSLKARKQ